ncbi:MAG: hydrogenase [Sulfurovum sp.]|nr:MAG: hydrogenase [Sulfurovum sp.]
MYNIFQNKINQNRAMRKPKADGELSRLQHLLKEEIKRNFSSKLKLYIIDTGSCGACEVELEALFNPLYGADRLGMEVVYNIREADILLLTGLLTENMYPICSDAYKNLKEPKHIISIGDCMMFNVAFKDTFAIKGQADIHFKIETHIGGCPPDPKTLFRGILKYLQALNEKVLS